MRGGWVRQGYSYVRTKTALRTIHHKQLINTSMMRLQSCELLYAAQKEVLHKSLQIFVQPGRAPPPFATRRALYSAANLRAGSLLRLSQGCRGKDGILKRRKVHSHADY